jgi:O-antigen/teichoic acid export membrane protein
VTLFLGALLGFAVTPILFNHLGTVAFGTWSLVIGTVTYLSLLEAGIGLATITRVAASEDSGPETLGQILSTSLALFCVVTVVGIGLSGVVAATFPLLFHVPSRLTGSAQWAVFLVGAWQSISFLTNAYSTCLLGTGRMHLVNLSGFAVSALTSIAQVAVVLTGGGIVGLAAVQCVGAPITFLVFRWQVQKVLPRSRIHLRYADRAMARLLVSLGWRNSVTSVSLTLAFGSDVVLVGLLLNPIAAAAYAIALRIYTLLQRITTGAIGAIGPVHARAAVSDTPERRFRLYCLSLSASLGLALFAALTVGVYGEALLRLWIGGAPAATSHVLILLCAVLALQTPGFSAYSVLLSSEQAGALMHIVVAAALTNVLASVLFTLAFGTIGPALGSLVAVAVFDAAYLPSRTCSLLDARYSRLVSQVFLPLLLPVVVLAGILAVGRLTVPDGPGVLIVIMLGGAAFLAVLSQTEAARDIWRLVRREPAATT